MAKGRGGEVYIYKSKSKIKLSDWSKAGHIMRQTKGERIIHAKMDPIREKIVKKEFSLVTKDIKKV